MLSATAAILLATAFVAGVTGAWSPCGFSMVETLGGARAHRGASVVRTSCATFALGALAGGALTFTVLAALGSALGAGSDWALVVAGTAALSCAVGEALGVRVVPQIRRQVPEPWRRTLPLPLAVGLYGVLLGLGFTTFVLTLAVWALAGIAIALGDPLAGLLIGLGFGAGRALPVVLMAPRYATLGRRLELAMAERPGLLRGLRLADGALLGACAVVLLAAGGGIAEAAAPAHRDAPPARAAWAAEVVADGATDPSAAPGALAWRQLDGRAVVLAGDARAELPAQGVALGGPYLATREGETIVVRDRASGAVVAQRAAPGATQLAVSDRWLAWRATNAGGGERLLVSPLPGLQSELLVAGVRDRGRIGRPSLDGDRLAYTLAAGAAARGGRYRSRAASRIVLARLDASGAHERRTVLRARLAELSQPSLRGERLLFVHATHCSQRLRLVRVGGALRSARTLARIGTTARRDRGHEHRRATQGREPGACSAGTPPRTDAVLWTTALDDAAAYVTLMTPGAAGRPAAATLARVALGG